MARPWRETRGWSSEEPAAPRLPRKDRRALGAPQGTDAWSQGGGRAFCRRTPGQSRRLRALATCGARAQGNGRKGKCALPTPCQVWSPPPPPRQLRALPTVPRAHRWPTAPLTRLPHGGYAGSPRPTVTRRKGKGLRTGLSRLQDYKAIWLQRRNAICLQCTQTMRLHMHHERIPYL